VIVKKLRLQRGWSQEYLAKANKYDTINTKAIDHESYNSIFLKKRLNHDQ